MGCTPMVDGVMRLVGSCGQILVGRGQQAQDVVVDVDVAHGSSMRYQVHHVFPRPKLLV